MTQRFSLLHPPPLPVIALFGLGAILACTGGAGKRGLKDLGIDNSLAIWLENDPKAASVYHDFTRKFGNENQIIVAFIGEHLVEPRFLDTASALGNEIESLDGVDDGGVAGVPMLWAQSYSPDQIDLFKELLKRPSLQNLMVGEKGNAMGLFVRPQQGREADLARALKPILQNFRRTTEAWGVTTAMAGSPAINAALDSGSSRDAALFMPLVFVLSLLMLAAIFRNVTTVTVIALTAGVPVVIGLGILAATGRDLNMITSVLPSLMWVLSLSHTIHIGHELRALMRNEIRSAAIIGAVDRLWRPCVYSALTTACGFASLQVSGIKVVSDLGIFAAAGILVGLLSSVYLLPALCHVFESAFRYVGSSMQTDARPFPGGRRPLRTITLSLALFVFAALLVTRVHSESNILSFLSSDDPVVRDTALVSENLTGVYSIEIEARLPGETITRQAVEAFRQFASEVESSPHVARVHSLATDPGENIQMLNGSIPSDLYHEESNSARLSVLVRSLPSSAYEAVLAQVRKSAASNFGPVGISYLLTGSVPLIINFQSRLVRGTLKSFGMAFAVILIVIVVTVRKPRLILASLIPNLAPSAAVMAAMGALGIQLDAATMMVASVSFGIGVDDTLHLLHRFRQELRTDNRLSSAPDDLGLSTFREDTLGPALARTRASAGGALIVTTLVNTAGFAVLGMATFKPLAWFGMLTSLALLVALAGDFVLLPASLIFLCTPTSNRRIHVSPTE